MNLLPLKAVSWVNKRFYIIIQITSRGPTPFDLDQQQYQINFTMQETLGSKTMCFS